MTSNTSPRPVHFHNHGRKLFWTQFVDAVESDFSCWSETLHRHQNTEHVTSCFVLLRRQLHRFLLALSPRSSRTSHRDRRERRRLDFQPDHRFAVRVTQESSIFCCGKHNSAYLLAFPLGRNGLRQNLMTSVTIKG